MVAVMLDPAIRRGGWFHVGMSGACVLLAFGAFAPTYWLQVAAGTFVGSPLLHIHGVLFSLWTLLLLSQSLLIANGRYGQHRAWGMAGISLATAMVFIGLAAAIGTLKAGLAAGYGDASRAFLILPVSGITLFAGFFAAALACVRRPAAHQRLMLLGTIVLLQAAMARVFFILMTGGGPGLRPGLGEPPPLIIGLVPSLILTLLIVAGIVHDWRTRGRPHPAWVAGLVIVTAVILLRGPLSGTAGWLAFADLLAHL
jgi:hypothetical protein